MEFNIQDILRTVYGTRGLAFPLRPTEDKGNPIADDYPAKPVVSNDQRSRLGAPLWGTNLLGMPVFMPATIDGVVLHNPLITITGEKEIVETVLVDVGTVFERVFTRPYNISIIMTLINNENTWPEKEVRELLSIWQKDDVVTISCALTDLFLNNRDNMVITNISMLDMQGVENAQVIEINGRSNIDFELELKPQ